MQYKIGLQTGSKQLVVTRHFKDCPYWDIWISTNDYKLGTFVRLHHDGLVEKITVRADEPCDEVWTIKPKD